jgi:hypothetical protein
VCVEVGEHYSACHNRQGENYAYNCTCYTWENCLARRKGSFIHDSRGFTLWLVDWIILEPMASPVHGVRNA